MKVITVFALAALTLIAAPSFAAAKNKAASSPFAGLSGFPDLSSIFQNLPAFASAPVSTAGVADVQACINKALGLDQLQANIQKCIPQNLNSANQQQADALDLCLQAAVPDPGTTQVAVQKCVQDAVSSLTQAAPSSP